MQLSKQEYGIHKIGSLLNSAMENLWLFLLVKLVTWVFFVILNNLFIHNNFFFIFQKLIEIQEMIHWVIYLIINEVHSETKKKELQKVQNSLQVFLVLQLHEIFNFIKKSIDFYLFFLYRRRFNKCDLLRVQIYWKK